MKLPNLFMAKEEAEKSQTGCGSVVQADGGAMTDVPTVNLTAEQANAKLIDVLTAAKVFFQQTRSAPDGAAGRPVHWRYCCKRCGNAAQPGNV